MFLSREILWHAESILRECSSIQIVFAGRQIPESVASSRRRWQLSVSRLAWFRLQSGLDFNIINLSRKISKFQKSLGVAGKSLEWFRSYLSGRVQQTMSVNALSPPAKITMGVPQGSILEPLLFLMYINGIQSELQHSKMTRCLLMTWHFIVMRTRQPICNQSSMQTWQLLHLGYMTISWH